MLGRNHCRGAACRALFVPPSALRVRCLGLGELEEGTGEGGKAVRVQVFDDLHHGGSIAAVQAGIAVDERVLNQRDPLALHEKQLVQAQLVLGHFQTPARHVHAENIRELPIGQHRVEGGDCPQSPNRIRPGPLIAEAPGRAAEAVIGGG